MSREISRSQFIQRLSMLGLGAVGLGGLVSGCGSDDGGQQDPSSQARSSESAADPCADLSGLTDVEMGVRKTFEYVAKSPMADKVCDNCQFWTAPAAGSPCGGCQIMKGPIHPKGYCKQWTAVAA